MIQFQFPGIEHVDDLSHPLDSCSEYMLKGKYQGTLVKYICSFINKMINVSLNSLSGQLGRTLNKYIRHYDGLSYDTDALHESHQRAKRALSPHDRTVNLDFHAHGRSVKYKCTHPL